jgi:hypothetical protein
LTAAVLDEPHLWLPSNGGLRLAATIRRNLAKMGGRSIETTNAWRDGEDSVAEATSRYADLAREGRTRNARILRMHPRANVPDLAEAGAARKGLIAVRGHAVDRRGPHRLRGLRPEHRPGRRSPVLPQRDHLGRRRAGDGAQWDVCKVDDRSLTATW